MLWIIDIFTLIVGEAFINSSRRATISFLPDPPSNPCAWTSPICIKNPAGIVAFVVNLRAVMH